MRSLPAVVPRSPVALVDPYTWERVVTRPDDMLVLRVRAAGLELKGFTLKPDSAQDIAYLGLFLQGQAIGEEAIGATDSVTQKPTQSRLASESRIVFEVPPKKSIPFTLKALLTGGGHPLSLSPRALPPGGDTKAKVEEPALVETAIEVPYRLVMSPDARAGWAHAIDPVVHNGRTEAWHTRLGFRKAGGQVDEASPVGVPPVRALWTPKATDDFNGSPASMPLTPEQREQIVQNSSDYLQGGYEPVPIEVRRLVLSALGASFDFRGTWDEPNTGVESWVHRGAWGRDSYVRIVERGALFPVGHEATLISVSERRFEHQGQGAPIAVLRKRNVLVVRQAVKTYPVFGETQSDGRAFPFTSIELTTTVTPLITQDPVGKLAAFWPQVDGSDLQFPIIATDHAGRRVEFVAPLLFVPVGTNVIYDRKSMKVLTGYYNQLGGDHPRRKWQLSGQSVAFAPPAPGRAGETSLPTSYIVAGAEPLDQASAEEHRDAGQPAFAPIMTQASSRLPAAEQFAGAAAGVTLVYHEHYLNTGFGQANPLGVYLARPGDDPIDLTFTGSGGGGVATPDMAVYGISRANGALAGPLTDALLVNGTFEPSKAFDSLTARLLGSFRLADVVGAVTLDPNAGNPAGIGLPGADSRAPVLTHSLVYPPGAGPSAPIASESRLYWDPVLKAFGPFQPQSGAKLAIEVVNRAPFDGSPPKSFVRGRLTDFAIELLGNSPIVTVQFSELTFETVAGEKPSIKPAISGVSFSGALAFVQQLEPYLAAFGGAGQPAPALPSGDPTGLAVDVAGNAIVASYTLGLPTIPLGAFVLENISFTAGIELPFDARPLAFRFAFASRDNPFHVIVYGLGGGGYVGLQLSAKGIDVIEASIEAGAQLSLNFGVASGSVHAFIGIFIRYAPGGLTVGGFVRLGGEVCVLGLVSASIEMTMSLAYTVENGQSYLVGQATIAVEVEVAFFSKTVRIHTERRIAGSAVGAGAIPAPAATLNRFRTVVSQDDWNEYCDAFD